MGAKVVVLHQSGSEELVVDVKISVLTATQNAQRSLATLIRSLESQSDPDFQWVVADGGSEDQTLAMVQTAASLLADVHFDSRPDSGIYSALNRAIALASGNYYLVLGSDDALHSRAIEHFKTWASSSPADLITAPVRAGSAVLRGKTPSWLWLYGAPAVLSSHSVGTLIRKDLHNELGFYDESFQVYGDGFFLLQALKKGAKVAKYDFIVGDFGTSGLSNSSQLISFSEQLRAQLKCGGSLPIQLALFILRVVRWRLVVSVSPRRRRWR